MRIYDCQIYEKHKREELSALVFALLSLRALFLVATKDDNCLALLGLR
jgi:hypothetical protein